MLNRLLVLMLLSVIVLTSSIRRIANYRHYVALGVAIVSISLGLLPLNKVLNYVDVDVIGLIIGMSIMTVFIELSGLAEFLALTISKYVRKPSLIILSLSLTAGIISIALENVSVVLIMAPIAFALASKLKIDPKVMIISIALASNLSGSATMIGDPQAIITAGYFRLAFGDFIVYGGKPSMFFFTLAALVLACLSLAFIARTKYLKSNHTENIRTDTMSEVKKEVDKIYILETVLFLSVKIILLTFRNELGIPLSFAAFIAITGLTITRLTIHRDVKSVINALKGGFEWRVAMFLIGVFTIAGSFSEQGLANDLANLIYLIGGNNLFLITSTLVWISVLASAFIDNVPYIATMLPVVEGLQRMLNIDPIVLAWALLLGATLGGNLTFIGASANVVAVRLLEKKGFQTSFIEFTKLSIPFNTVSVLSGWLLYELTWILT